MVHNTRASAEWASSVHVPSSSWCQKGQQQAQTLAWLGINKNSPGDSFVTAFVLSLPQSGWAKGLEGTVLAGKNNLCHSSLFLLLCGHSHTSSAGKHRAQKGNGLICCSAGISAWISFRPSVGYLVKVAWIIQVLREIFADLERCAYAQGWGIRPEGQCIILRLPLLMLSIYLWYWSCCWTHCLTSTLFW